MGDWWSYVRCPGEKRSYFVVFYFFGLSISYPMSQGTQRNDAVQRNVLEKSLKSRRKFKDLRICVAIYRNLRVPKAALHYLKHFTIVYNIVVLLSFLVESLVTQGLISLSTKTRTIFSVWRYNDVIYDFLWVTLSDLTAKNKQTNQNKINFQGEFVKKLKNQLNMSDTESNAWF